MTHSTNKALFVELDKVTEKMIEDGAENFDKIIADKIANNASILGEPLLIASMHKQIDGLVYYISEGIKAGQAGGTLMTSLDDGKEAQYFCFNFPNPFANAAP